MKDEQLRQMFAELPQEKASPGFTKRVLVRMDQRRDKPASWLQWSFYLALAVVTTIGLVYGLQGWHSTNQEHIRKEINQLRAEQRALTASLADLRSKLTQARPTVYLGGDLRVDYVLDLKDYFRIRPANFEGFR